MTGICLLDCLRFCWLSFFLTVFLAWTLLLTWLILNYAFTYLSCCCPGLFLILPLPTNMVANLACSWLSFCLTFLLSYLICLTPLVTISKVLDQGCRGSPLIISPSNQVVNTLVDFVHKWWINISGKRFLQLVNATCHSQAGGIHLPVSCEWAFVSFLVGSMSLHPMEGIAVKPVPATEAAPSSLHRKGNNWI